MAPADRTAPNGHDLHIEVALISQRVGDIRTDVSQITLAQSEARASAEAAVKEARLTADAAIEKARIAAEVALEKAVLTVRAETEKSINRLAAETKDSFGSVNSTLRWAMVTMVSLLVTIASTAVVYAAFR